MNRKCVSSSLNYLVQDYISDQLFIQVYFSMLPVPNRLQVICMNSFSLLKQNNQYYAYNDHTSRLYNILVNLAGRRFSLTSIETWIGEWKHIASVDSDLAVYKSKSPSYLLDSTHYQSRRLTC